MTAITNSFWFLLPCCSLTCRTVRRHIWRICLARIDCMGMYPWHNSSYIMSYTFGLGLVFSWTPWQGRLLPNGCTWHLHMGGCNAIWLESLHAWNVMEAHRVLLLLFFPWLVCTLHQPYCISENRCWFIVLKSNITFIIPEAIRISIITLDQSYNFLKIRICVTYFMVRLQQVSLQTVRLYESRLSDIICL